MQVTPIPRSSSRENERGLGLGIGLIAILLALFLAVMATDFKAGPAKPGPNTVFLGLYLIAWGCMFLAAYYYSHKSFFLRGLIWVCEHFSHPAHRKMAFFYFALSAGLGSIAVIQGLGLV